MRFPVHPYQSHRVTTEELGNSRIVFALRSSHLQALAAPRRDDRRETFAAQAQSVVSGPAARDHPDRSGEETRISMKLRTAVLVTASTVLFAGCTPAHYSRSIAVHKDANGVITGTTETETYSEQHSEMAKIKGFENTNSTFRYLKSP
jgi:hypothetical protein